MLDDVHKRRFDIVLCWALDRFSREGMMPTIAHLQRLAAAGVGFHSYTEPLISTDDDPRHRDRSDVVARQTGTTPRRAHPPQYRQGSHQRYAEQQADWPAVDR